MAIPPKREASARELRDLFKAVLERAAAGELTTKVVADRHPSSPQAHVPVCTRSQMVVYLDGNGDEVATAHRYLKTDGTLGASGLPDPKRVVAGGVLYVLWWGTPLGER